MLEVKQNLYAPDKISKQYKVPEHKYYLKSQYNNAETNFKKLMEEMTFERLSLLERTELPAAAVFLDFISRFGLKFL
jgi:hypothetical protein